ncbi:UDP-N-acetylmuramoyl-tripeptide--D-alanyl-D-alanine ligase [Halpernia frigidisoli]|uniref:UDP-N-acetylmuramoyl-tripeptide--D-alanyl-D-alanine ligase n=1 Tax=Halpernia frigidisoli TaxID=1125876 RepID=A0A1I3CSL1_9FLAO|nr:UDP-N-acetylmuramoyl-tripeptide--D-alanyl-D-alanine ligase [Halpernia frigidisoli]SFH77241.1 UDP-N-acetylmuramoyl-tripeptide--D-alanyl-D-alanine ligase [Halpernia frigidisoli]
MDVKDFYSVLKKANKVCINSKDVSENDVFFAFSGESFNGASKALEAIEKGALAVIVEDQSFENSDKNILFVESTLKFLQELALYHRSQLKIPVIGLTGSNGKTTTKELIHAVLSKKFKVQYTSGNLNNHIGVPLTLLSVKDFHEIAVIEMGANHQKEIEFLCTLAQPNIGYVTNFGKAHLEGFGGVEGVIKGKSELYDYLISNDQKILINENDPIQVEKTKNYQEKITFGKDESKFNFDLIRKNTFVGFKYKNEEIMSRLTGDYNFTNLCAAASLGLEFGISAEQIKEAVENYEPTNMRSQIMHRNGKILVLDTYNANPSSMVESLKNFSQFEGSKTVIIGDMLELGDESEKEHLEILNFAEGLNFDQIIYVGPNFMKIRPEKSYLTTHDLTEQIRNNPVETKNILLKASRGIALEKILEVL